MWNYLRCFGVGLKTDTYRWSSGLVKSGVQKRFGNGSRKWEGSLWCIYGSENDNTMIAKTSVAIR